MVFQSVDPHIRFWSHVTKTSTCWLWTASLDMGGYGQFSPTRTETRKAHRWLWEQFHGPVSSGYQLDHLCRTRNCVNPNHLEMVTPRANTLRGIGPSASNAKKTACPQGHSYDEDNTRITPSGGRVCRACMRARHHRDKSRRKAAI